MESSKKGRGVSGSLAIRLTDLLQKWTIECKTVEEIRDVLVKEQVLNSLSLGEMTAEVAELVSCYLWT